MKLKEGVERMTLFLHVVVLADLYDTKISVVSAGRVLPLDLLLICDLSIDTTYSHLGIRGLIY